MAYRRVTQPQADHCKSLILNELAIFVVYIFSKYLIIRDLFNIDCWRESDY